MGQLLAVWVRARSNAGQSWVRAGVEVAAVQCCALLLVTVRCYEELRKVVSCVVRWGIQ